MALLLASYGLRAQDRERLTTLPTPGGASFSGTITRQTLPHVTEGEGHEAGHEAGHGGHEAEEEDEHGEEAWGGLYGSADFLLMRPRRRPHDFAIVDRFKYRSFMSAQSE